MVDLQRAPVVSQPHGRIHSAVPFQRDEGLWIELEGAVFVPVVGCSNFDFGDASLYPAIAEVNDGDKKD
jgi:hypothetical protein